jgi:dTDP-4-dehydrorhamnose 3,5-epimerase
VKLEPLALDGAYRLRPDRRGDERGHLERLFCRDTFRGLGLKDCSEQVSEVVNAQGGTLRGLHFQRAPHGETKLIRVVRGAVYDVLVDVRPGSPTYGRWQGFELCAGDGSLIYAPAGLAHGYLTLSDDSAMLYFMDTAYAPEHAAGLHYADPALAIAWPAAPAVIADRDRAWPTMDKLSGA